MEHTPGDNCSTPEGSVAGGRIAMHDRCKLKTTSAPATISVEGAYSEQGYHTVIKALATFNGTPMEINFNVDGKFVGPCKGDEERWSEPRAGPMRFGNREGSDEPCRTDDRLHCVALRV